MGNFKNRTIWTGDNLPIMRGLNSESVDLIYLDPPFNSNKEYSAPIGSKAAGAAFKDTWTLDDVDRLWLLLLRDKDPTLFHVIEAARLAHGKGMAAYLSMMAQRLWEMSRILKPTGSIYLHCDPTVSHYLKLLLDCVFAPQNFRNEIIWHYQTSSGKPLGHFIKNTDAILFYAKGGAAAFNVIREPWPETTLRKWQRDENGVYRTNNGKKFYIHPDGKRMDNVWKITLSSRSTERTGYPTQKPLALLDRIIKASSNEDDVVLDPFAGCATALVSAERWGRHWLGIDLSHKAYELVKSRLQGAIKELELYHPGDVIHRTDQPQRTDLGKLPPPAAHKNLIYGKQSGQCGGCMVMFHKRNLTIDHIVPKKNGGTDHVENLWLLCGACNSSKGTKSQAEFLRERVKRGESIEWLQ